MKCPRCGETVAVLYSGVEEVIVLGVPKEGCMFTERRRVTMCGKCQEEYDTLPYDTPLTPDDTQEVDVIREEERRCDDGLSLQYGSHRGDDVL